jgi:hypothetical protein
MRGKHTNRWNLIPQEVVDDILDFINGLPARDSHYSKKTVGNLKYLSTDLNISKLYNNFLTLFPEYEKCFLMNISNFISKNLI